MKIWFLTDGEETVYMKENDTPEHIPSNPADKNHIYFNSIGPDGITQ